MKHNTYRAYLLSVILVLMFSSCHSIYVENIEKKTITIIGPADHVVTNTESVTFWWQLLDNAEQYRFQVVSPSFDSMQRFVMDSIVVGDKITVQLTPGKYQWRVRGENAGYNTQFTIHTLTIDSTTDLSAQTLLLASPADNYATSKTQNKFSWSPFTFANDYRFEIASPDFSGTTIVSINLAADTFTYTLAPGRYQWRVRAQNASSNSPFATRSMVIDTTMPVAPELISPVSGSLVHDTIQLQWTRAAFVATDSIFIYSDSMLTPPISTTVSNVNSSTYINASLGTYFWRVRSVDSASNVSPYSNLWKFINQ